MKEKSVMVMKSAVSVNGIVLKKITMLVLAFSVGSNGSNQTLHQAVRHVLKNAQMVSIKKHGPIVNVRVDTKYEMVLV